MEFFLGPVISCAVDSLLLVAAGGAYRGAGAVAVGKEEARAHRGGQEAESG
jgi:hypothetical protein